MKTMPLVIASKLQKLLLPTSIKEHDDQIPTYHSLSSQTVVGGASPSLRS